MSTETMERPVAAAPVAALAPTQRAAVVLNTAEYEIKLRELLTNSVGILAVTNKAGRDECHSAYMVLKNTRCGITNLAEDATEDAKAFTKAVKTEAARLIAITTAEEDRLQALRDKWDDAEQARKDALIAAERARVEAIQARIQGIRDLPMMAVGRDSAMIGRVIAELDAILVDESFAEFRDIAAAAWLVALEALNNALATAKGHEQAALAAEQARIAEAARIEAERVELARQRAENERIANEQAAERQRLADLAAAQEAAATKQREAAEANLRAEQAALAERQRIADEAQAKAAAELQAAQDKHAAEVAAHAAAVKMAADHAEALADNATFDAAMARLAAIEVPAFTQPALRVLIDAEPLPLPESASETDALIDAGFSEEPTDSELVDLYVENFGGTHEQAIVRLARFDALAAFNALAVA